MSHNYKNFNHDKFFRRLMMDTNFARQFFTMHLPNYLQDAIDLNNLVLQPGSHINKFHQEGIVDILYKTIFKKVDKFLYLLVEHQSSANKLMPFRFFHYRFNIMAHHQKITKETSFPLVYSILLYHGQAIYPYSMNMEELIDAPREFVDRIFLKPPQLIDLTTLDDTVLKNDGRVALIEYILKHIWNKNILVYLYNIKPQIKKIMREEGGRKFILNMLGYVLVQGNFPDNRELYKFATDISKELGGTIMTLGERIFQEGKEEGKEEGREEGREEGIKKISFEIARKLLLKKANIAYIAEITNLSIESIQEIKQAMG